MYKLLSLADINSTNIDANLSDFSTSHLNSSYDNLFDFIGKFTLSYFILWQIIISVAD